MKWKTNNKADYSDITNVLHCMHFAKYRLSIILVWPNTVLVLIQFCYSLVRLGHVSSIKMRWAEANNNCVI